MKKLILIHFVLTIGINFVNAQWTPINNGLTDSLIETFAVDGNDIYVATRNGVSISTDMGANWTSVSNGLTVGYPIYSLAVLGTNIFAGNTWGVFQSTDKGANWTEINNGLPYAPQIYCITVSGTNIFAAAYGSGVYLSSDTGKNWAAVNNGLTNLMVAPLAVNGTNIFAGTYRGGVFLSTNNGASWNAVNNGLPDSTYYGSLVASGTNIFAGLADGKGIFLSSDTGKSWHSVNNGLTHKIIYPIAVSGMDIFAGTNGGGVFLSINNGGNWLAFNDGLPPNFVATAMTALTVSGSYIFMGSYYGGAWKRPLSDILTVENIDTDNNDLSIYPNPLRYSFKLQLNSKLRNAEVFIYDVFGKEMIRKKLIDNRTEIERSSLANGIYFVRIMNDKNQYVKKIVVE